MILAAPYFLEYFQGFDPFYGGLFGSFYLFLLVWLFSYLGARGHVEKPTERALEMTVPVYVFGFAMNVMGMPPVVTGIGVIVVFLVLIKIIGKTPTVPFIFLSIYFIVIFGILSFVDPWIRNILLVFSLTVAYLKGNAAIKDKKKEKGKEKKD